MNANFVLALASICLNIIGTIILAFALNTLIKSIENSILGLEITRDSQRTQDFIVIGGMDIIRKKSNIISKRKCLVGILIVILGNLLQLFSVLLYN